MPTIFSNAKGQVIKATDDLGVYYYLADGLGQTTTGAWEREDDAIAALEGRDRPVPSIGIDEWGNRYVRCLYCRHEVSLVDVPALDDDAAWDELARDHADDCEWVATRAHRVTPA